MCLSLSCCRRPGSSSQRHASARSLLSEDGSPSIKTATSLRDVVPTALGESADMGDDAQAAPRTLKRYNDFIMVSLPPCVCVCMSVLCVCVCARVFCG